MQNNNVLISGAGIAGPALAYWLRKAGYAPTIVERAPSLRPGGQAVDLRGAGRTVIERMGLLDHARELALDQKGFALVDTRNRITARIPADAFGGKGIVSEIEILRGDLGQLLYDASLPFTEYIFDDTITGIEQDENGVDVTLEKAPARRFALVVGADGLHSRVRRLTFGPHEALIQSFSLYEGWFTAHTDIDLDGWFLMYNAPGVVAGARPGRLPGELKVGLVFRSDPVPEERGTVEAQKELIARRFEGAGWKVPQLVEAMHTAPDFVFDSVGQVRMEHWTQGRVALVGDAGYCPTPLTGLGTSLALVGAHVLAGELAAARGDHRAAFARYEERMRPYVANAQELPPGGVDGFAPPNAFMIGVRAISMRWMTRWPIRNLVASQFEKAGEIALPDYESEGAAA